ncbi:D-alanyl-D-alanine carboxypeptidase [Mucilaginibacter sp. KACC 22063]|uniref:D-alanyl-D-alanine carboxypeptidase n=1 Tax=Mucilaginibacter sp. KACC 22063 TaxID=3025666 RepID=UPI0023656AB9|nr:D-alanyl-D-alanine carboxypeptidase [Mucilaginibacter sp. KACC 22063]WDF55476.1 D-alanyl-D-alanine carboxypeptidase [Mucilaginibacter sp. KACC 22063]
MLRKVIQVLIIVLAFGAVKSVAYGDGIKKRKIKKLFKESAIMQSHFTGFALYDMDKQDTVLLLNADKYFTPASNTKLFTFYTSLKILGDSIPALKYQIHGDSLLFWGTGDPSFLHPDLIGNNGFNFLKQSDKKLFYCSGTYQNKPFGSGWAWDDYNDYYQAEINDFPLYGNLIEVYADANNHLATKPAYFKQCINTDSAYTPDKFSIQRSYISNRLTAPAMAVTAGFKQYVPWQISDTLTVKLLSDTLKKQVVLLHKHIPANSQLIYNANADTVYRHMLQPSDNFIAEQLLLACSSVKFGYLNSDSVRKYAVDSLLNDLPDKPQWADGSGLSRLNLFTPRDMITLLNKISAEFKDEQFLHSLLPEGGVSGTIKHAYATDNGQPFVWAKTGSLSNNYNQSGYMVTKQGRRLCFSFMNNNFTEPTSVIRNEMVRIITYIHDNF